MKKTQNNKRRPYGRVRVCEGARACGKVGVAVCRCACAGYLLIFQKVKKKKLLKIDFRFLVFFLNF